MTALMDFEILPRDCLTKIISSTTPAEACILSSVSKPIKLIADSDEVWESFLRPILSNTAESSSNGNTSKKQLYLTLTEHPILIEDGKKSFSLEKKSGKKCYMLAPNDLVIIGVNSRSYWRWLSILNSTFPIVVELLEVRWLEIRGAINTRMLSGKTLYAAYLVFKTTAYTFGFENQVVEVAFGPEGGKSNKRAVFLDCYDKNRLPPSILRRGIFHRPTFSYPPRETSPDLKEREDGWLEVELGDFYHEGNIEEELEMSVTETKNLNGKGGIIIQGIEIRPKVVSN